MTTKERFVAAGDIKSP